MEMEICNRKVICNVWCLSVSGYNEERQKLCGSSRNKKRGRTNVERRVQRKSVTKTKGRRTKEEDGEDKGEEKKDERQRKGNQ